MSDKKVSDNNNQNDTIDKDLKVDKKVKTTKKTGPKKPYAIDNLMKVLSEEKIKEIKLKYYIEKVPKYKLAKEIGLSHQLMDKFLERIGKLTAKNIKDL